ncbi:hypothetical protein CON07_05670 [Bacillus sp. AFS094611]|uniref:Uncharacterized protein n=1 Tax=Bacillus anthracis TaxID=1392 RepID=A0A2A7D7B6_BACAN|nr:hypothetical protein CON16_17495 [Bacillus anthracis]PDZ52472.1 hypothetical protein CON07_05670 [Bacillus sp. AFS094611]
MRIYNVKKLSIYARFYTDGAPAPFFCNILKKFIVTAFICLCIKNCMDVSNTKNLKTLYYQHFEVFCVPKLSFENVIAYLFV